MIFDRLRNYFSHPLRASLKLLGIFFACVMIAAASIAVTLIVKPEWVLNTQTLSFAFHHFAKSLSPTWEDLKFQIYSPRLFRDELKIHAKNFCIRSKLNGCFSDIDLEMAVHWSFGGLRRLELSRILVRSDRLEYARPSQNKLVQQSSQESFHLPKLDFRLPHFKTLLRVGVVSIEVSDVKWSENLSFKIGVKREDGPILANIDGTTFRGNESSQKFTAEFIFDSDLWKSGRLSWVDARGNLRTESEKQWVKVSARAERDLKREDQTNFAISSEASDLSGQAKLSLTGYENPEKLSLSLPQDGEASLNSRWGSAQLSKFILESRFKARSFIPQNLNFNFESRLGPRAFRKYQKYRFLPKTLRALFTGSVQFFEKNRFKSQAKLELEPMEKKRSTPYFISLASSLDGSLNQIRQSLESNLKLEAEASISKFENLVADLQSTKWAIPAPLNSLKGSIELKISGPKQIAANPKVMTIRLETRLTDQKQKFITQTEGELKISDWLTDQRRFFFNANSKLEQVAIELPPLDLQNLPHIKFDSRIKTGPVLPNLAASAESHQASEKKFQYQIRLETTVHPLLLYSNLTKGPVPIRLAYDFRSDGMSHGSVVISRFNFEMFRRIATIDHIRIRKVASSDLSELEGLIYYKTTDVTVKILLNGTVSKPRTTFESDPPMNTQQILALLLFGKSPTDLDSDESSTVGELGPALASGAFGLASLYLLASTPVEYVGYDPGTQTYSVKLRVASGTSLELSSTPTQSTQQMTLRKRIAKHWQIVTELKNIEDEGTTVFTFLEWFKRF